MKRISRVMLTACALLCMLFPSLQALSAEAAPQRELRAGWLTTVFNIDWPMTKGADADAAAKQQRQMLDYLDGMSAAGLNAVFFQVRSMSDAVYRSHYEPWSVYLTGERGKDPGWDPLAFAVEECHKRGLECHAWINPYRFCTKKTADWDTPQDMVLKNGGRLLTWGDVTVHNPGLKESRDRIVDVCSDIVKHYDVDGIVFDDYFYPDHIPCTAEAPDYELWQRTGKDMSFADWRRANVNQMVADVWNMLQKESPEVRFGIGPAGVACTESTSAGKYGIKPCPKGSDWQYDRIFSDPVAWLAEGTIDYISPQIYWKTDHKTNPFGPITEWWSYAAHRYGRHHYASHNVYFMGKDGNIEENWAEIAEQIRLNRRYNEDSAPGVVFYNSKYLRGPEPTGFGNYLRNSVFASRALTPAVTWKKHKSHGAPQKLKLSGNTLTWKKERGRLVKYAVYALPAGAAVGNLDACELLAVTYKPQFAVPEQLTGCNAVLAVTVLDGFNNEYAPAFINIK